MTMYITSLVGGNEDKHVFLLGLLHAYINAHKHILVIPNIRKCQTHYSHRHGHTPVTD